MTGSESDSAGESGGLVVQFCPHCGDELDLQSFVQEYWTADSRVFHVWCEACGSVFDVTPTTRVTTHEPAH